MDPWEERMRAFMAMDSAARAAILDIGADMNGRRVYDKEPHELQPGDYGRWAQDGNWYAVPPGNPDLCANLSAHSVVEHDDGTITVSPSILISRGQPDEWHGFLERGVWRVA